MKIRIMGTEDECREVAERLAGIIEVLEISEPRANRGASRQVRVYVEARIAPPVHVTAMADHAQGRRRQALPPGDAR